MSVKFVINKEETAFEKYYSVTGIAGKHEFYRYGKFSSKKEAKASADLLSGWDKVNTITDKEVLKVNALSRDKKMARLKKLCGENNE